ncbi:ketosteroid isomerase-related protein [soil metagenome]
MSLSREETVTLISRYYDIFNQGDREAFLTLLDEQVQHDINQGGAEVGLEAFRTFLQRMDRCYREQVEELQVFASETGDRAAAEFYINGTYLTTDDGLPPATGQKYRLRVGAFFEISRGKVSRVTNYYNLGEWLRLIGA